MKIMSRLAPLSGLTLFAVAPAFAAFAQIDSFSASAISVVAGSTVDFSVSFSVVTSAWVNGGSNPIEPEPQDGYQTWDINWYSYENESLTQVWFDAAGQNFTDYVVVPAGSSYMSGWSFSVLFPTAGRFDITLGGGWSGWVDIYASNESASRDCWNIDPEGTNQLACSSWFYQYYDYSDYYSTDGGFPGGSLTIEVVADPVPEPPTLALWLAGTVGLLGLRCRPAARAGDLRTR